MSNLPAKATQADLVVSNPANDPSIGEMFYAAIKGGITSENASVVEKMFELKEREESRKAEKAFARAFIDLQRAIPRIKATKIIPDRNGGVRSSFAPFEEIDAQARPICLEHGFTYTFSEGDSDAGKITKICTLQHVDGHKRANPFTVRIGSGPPGCSESQADGAAHSYAKRGALCDCLNIVVLGIDRDAKIEGAHVTSAQAEELAHRVALTNSNRDQFLKFAGAASFAEIPAMKYDALDALLRKKEQGK